MPAIRGYNRIVDVLGRHSRAIDFIKGFKQRFGVFLITEFGIIPAQIVIPFHADNTGRGFGGIDDIALQVDLVIAFFDMIQNGAPYFAWLSGQGRFRELAFADVPVDGIDADLVPFDANWRTQDTDVDQTAVLMTTSGFHFDSFALGGA